MVIVGPTLEISGNSKLPRWGMMQHGIRQDCIFCTRVWDGLHSQYGPSVSGLRSPSTTNGKGLSITFGVEWWGFLVMQKLQCIILGTFLAMRWIWKIDLCEYLHCSVVGLHFDYVIFNLTKHFSYWIYNAALYFSPYVQYQYHEKYGFDEVLQE